MSDYIRISKDKWDKLGSMLEELYGMVHCLNDCLNNNQLDIAKKEAGDIENQEVKVLDLYNRIKFYKDLSLYIPSV